MINILTILNLTLKSYKKKYQYNTTYGLDYLFNEGEDYYKPREVKRAFNGGYIVYESRGDINANLSINEYFNIIKPYLGDLINDHKSRAEWKIKLTMTVIFLSIINANETQTMYSQIDNVIIMIGIETDDIINELINTFTKRYQEGLEKKNERKQFYF